MQSGEAKSDTQCLVLQAHTLQICIHKPVKSHFKIYPNFLQLCLLLSEVGGDRAAREESLGSVFTGKTCTEIAGHLPLPNSLKNERGAPPESSSLHTVTLTVPCPRQTCRSLACILPWNKTRQMQQVSPPTQCCPEDYIWELPRSFIFPTEGSNGIWVVPGAFSFCP